MVLILVLSIISILSISSAEQNVSYQSRGILSVEKTSYNLGEGVEVCIGVDDFGDLSLFVIIKDDVYQYMGKLEECVEFTPRVEGIYTIKLVNHVTLDLIDHVIFEIVGSREREGEKVVISKRIIRTNNTYYIIIFKYGDNFFFFLFHSI